MLNENTDNISKLYQRLLIIVITCRGTTFHSTLRRCFWSRVARRANVKCMRCQLSSCLRNKWRSQRSLPQGRSKEIEFFNSAHISSSIRGAYDGICFLLNQLLSCRLVSIFCRLCNRFCTFTYDFIINITCILQVAQLWQRDRVTEMEPGHGSPGHRVTGSAILTGSGRVPGQCFLCADPVL